MLGKFHEIGVATADIRESVEFYERLGFTQAVTGDMWPHPYGVVTDGRLFIGLHQRKFASPVVTFVKPGIAQLVGELERSGFTLAYQKTGDDVFNEVGLCDPTGQMLSVLEARTYSPVVRDENERSACGDFREISFPSRDFATARLFWEPLGFVATPEANEPYAHLPLTSDHLNVVFHRPRTLDGPALVFRDSQMGEKIARIRELGIELSQDLPRGLDAEKNALIESPEGLYLLLLTGES